MGEREARLAHPIFITNTTNQNFTKSIVLAILNLFTISDLLIYGWRITVRTGSVEKIV